MNNPIPSSTPTPWRIGDAGLTVFGPPNGQPSPVTVARCLNRANARAIVQAVNGYAAALAALRSAVGGVGYLARIAPIDPARVTEWEEWERNARAVLAGTPTPSPDEASALDLLSRMREFWANGTPVHPGSLLADEACDLLDKGAPAPALPPTFTPGAYRIRATRDHRTGVSGVLVVAKGALRTVNADAQGRFTTVTDGGAFFGVCQIGYGWELAP